MQQATHTNVLVLSCAVEALPFYLDESCLSRLCTFCPQVLEPSFRQPYPNVTRWFLTCVNQPQFKAVLGDLKLCEKMAQFDGQLDCFASHTSPSTVTICDVQEDRTLWAIAQPEGHCVET